jgi:hypothetical protein
LFIKSKNSTGLTLQQPTLASIARMMTTKKFERTPNEKKKTEFLFVRVTGKVEVT